MFNKLQNTAGDSGLYIMKYNISNSVTEWAVGITYFSGRMGLLSSTLLKSRIVPRPSETSAQFESESPSETIAYFSDS
jgi:hypothetical protein